jgi:hypothetical protein
MIERHEGVPRDRLPSRRHGFLLKPIEDGADDLLAQPTPSTEDRFLALPARFIGPILKGSKGSRAVIVGVVRGMYLKGGFRPFGDRDAMARMRK